MHEIADAGAGRAEIAEPSGQEQFAKQPAPQRTFRAIDNTGPQMDDIRMTGRQLLGCSLGRRVDVEIAAQRGGFVDEAGRRAIDRHRAQMHDARRWLHAGGDREQDARAIDQGRGVACHAIHDGRGTGERRAQRCCGRDIDHHRFDAGGPPHGPAMSGRDRRRPVAGSQSADDAPADESAGAKHDHALLHRPTRAKRQAARAKPAGTVSGAYSVIEGVPGSSGGCGR